MICATVTSDMDFPATSTLIQDAIGAPAAAGQDRKTVALLDAFSQHDRLKPV